MLYNIRPESRIDFKEPRSDMDVLSGEATGKKPSSKRRTTRTARMLALPGAQLDAQLVGALLESGVTVSCASPAATRNAVE